MKPSLQVRLSQHLALTPQLQQSIRLLQLSTLELHQEVEQMLEQNPFLEPDDDSGSPWDGPLERAVVPDRQAQSQADAEGSAEVGAEGGAEAMPEIQATDFAGSEREDWDNGSEHDDFDGIRELPSGLSAGSGAGFDDDEFEGQDRRVAQISLADHLRAQLPGLRLSAEDAAGVDILIESLNGDGYLADALDEIAQVLAVSLGLRSLGEADNAALASEGSADGNADASADGDANTATAGDTDTDASAYDNLISQLRCALHWLQRLDPPGVGARNLGECLTLQLRLLAPCAARRVALQICDKHLQLLARRDQRKLCAATGANEDLLRQAQALILACEPKPGRPFADAQSQIVVPDVIVQRAGRGLKVTLNPDVMPKLRINDLYASAVRGQRGGDLPSRLQEARWFMKNIQQRFDTILRVSQAIVERQRAFFTHGEIAMKPLVLREIADELGLHESTISRVTTAKYMATPGGTFELKYFFGSSLNTDAGGNASSTAVRALIKQLVAAEDPLKPLSDSALSEMLEEQGIQVARRTVAKYREALKIAPANQRKAI